MGGEARPWTREQSRRMHKCFQKTVMASLPAATCIALEPRIKHKLRHWRLPDFPRVLVRRAIAFLQHLRGRVPPRIWAAVFRALWNAWPTRRRLQGHGGLQHCVFECAADAQDSIEHYAYCRVLADLSLRELGLQRPANPQQRLPDFLGLLDAAPGVEVQTRRAIRIAATYRIHCLACHSHLPTGRPAREAFRQACREVVRGCLYGERVYDAAAGGWA